MIVPAHNASSLRKIPRECVGTLVFIDCYIAHSDHVQQKLFIVGLADGVVELPVPGLDDLRLHAATGQHHQDDCKRQAATSGPLYAAPAIRNRFVRWND